MFFHIVFVNVCVCVCGVFSVYPSESLSTALGPASTVLLRSLARCYSRLCHLTGQHSASLTANLRRRREFKNLVMLEHASIFLDTYNEYVQLCTQTHNV